MSAVLKGGNRAIRRLSDDEVFSKMQHWYVLPDHGGG